MKNARPHGAFSPTVIWYTASATAKWSAWPGQLGQSLFGPPVTMARSNSGALSQVVESYGAYVAELSRAVRVRSRPSRSFGRLWKPVEAKPDPFKLPSGSRMKNEVVRSPYV